MGYRNVAVVGRSAGAVGALALACNPDFQVPRLAVYAAEPVAVQNMTVREGRELFQDYMKQQQALQDEARRDPNSRLILPEPHGLTGFAALKRAAYIVHDSIADRQNSAKIWASGVTVDYARHLAAKRPDVAVKIDFAETSLSGNSDVFEAFQEIKELRDPEAEPFLVERVPNTTHASFDNRTFFAGRLAPVVAWLREE